MTFRFAPYTTRTVEVQLYKALKILRGILLSCLIFLSNF